MSGVKQINRDAKKVFNVIGMAWLKLPKMPIHVFKDVNPQFKGSMVDKI